MQVCTSLQTDNHASTSPLSFLQAGCPSCRPTNSIKALKAECLYHYWGMQPFFRIPILTDFLLPDNAASSFLRRVSNFCHMFKLKLPFFAKTLSVAV